MFWKPLVTHVCNTSIRVPSHPPPRLSKSTLTSRFAWWKVLIGLKRAPRKTNGLDIGCRWVFSGLVIGWWSKLRAGRPYPTQIWIPPGPPPPPPPPEGGGVLTCYDIRGCVAKMGRCFCKKSLNMGPIFHETMGLIFKISMWTRTPENFENLVCFCKEISSLWFLWQNHKKWVTFFRKITQEQAC